MQSFCHFIPFIWHGKSSASHPFHCVFIRLLVYVSRSKKLFVFFFWAKLQFAGTRIRRVFCHRLLCSILIDFISCHLWQTALHLQIKNPAEVDQKMLLQELHTRFEVAYARWRSRTGVFKLANLVVTLILVLVQVVQVCVIDGKFWVCLPQQPQPWRKLVQF